VIPIIIIIIIIITRHKSGKTTVLQRDMPPNYLISILLHHAALSCALLNHCVPGISRAETSSYAHWFHVMRVLPRERL
jgi:hypothetical protein